MQHINLNSNLEGDYLLYYESIFSTIQGEGGSAGYPTTFIRLYGCNLNCSYCDAPQEDKRKRRISVKNVIDDVKQRTPEHVCITGGEPLLQDEVFPVIYELVGENYNVCVETNGSVLIPDDLHRRSYKYVMDMKCPSSMMHHRNNYENLSRLHCNDELKFVIKNRDDYEFMRQVLSKYDTNAQILLSPMFENKSQVIGQKLSQWVLEDGLRARIQIQMHKILKID